MSKRPRPSAPPPEPDAAGLRERGKRLLGVVHAAQHWRRCRRGGGRADLRAAEAKRRSRN
jgi:hypothetical protein